MPLSASGSISIGGSTTGRSINLELGRASNATSSLNESALRTLAGVPSGSISLSSFYGKSSWTAAIGDFVEGGYYIGNVTVSSTAYRVILAPKDSESATKLIWSTSFVQTSASSLTDGLSNTDLLIYYSYFGTFAAANHCANLVVNGYSDWYLPAISELQLAYTNRNSLPEAQRNRTAQFDSTYWSSTEYANANYAQACNFFDGVIYQLSGKDNASWVRAVRRVAV